MGHDSPAPPFVAELNRFLELRSRWHESCPSATSGEEALAESDLLVLAFVISEMEVATLLVDDADLLERLQRAGLAQFVEDRSRRSLRVASLVDPRVAPAEAAIVCLDARQRLTTAETGRWSESLRAVVLYGLRDATPLGAFGRLEGALAGECVVVALGGRALALWKTTAVMVAPRAVARTVEAALERLSVLLADRSLDPLHLAQTCVDLQVRLRVKGDDEVTRARSRARELEDEVAELKERLLKQQQSLASYNEMISPTERAGRRSLPKATETTP